MGKAEHKYHDQVNDAHTVLGYRKRLSDHEAASSLRSGSGSKSDPVAMHDGSRPADRVMAEAASGSTKPEKTYGRHGYNPEAVDKAIASSNRSGRRIGGKERSAIHRLLRGR